MKYNV